VKLRKAYDVRDGVKWVPAGPGRPLGVPLHRAQVNARRDLVMVTVRHPLSLACRAVCFDPRDGRVAWQRQLGSIPPTKPRVTPAGVLLPDEDGGAVLLDPKASGAGTKPVPVDAAVCRPVPMPDGPSVTASNGRSTWVVVPERGEKDASFLRLRQI